YAWHPLRVESVAWVSEIKDVLAAFFMMLTLLAYAHYTERPSGRRYLLVTLALTFGLMSKPSIVTAPAVLLLLDVWPLNRIRGRVISQSQFPQRTMRQILLEKIPWFLMAAGGAWMSYLAQLPARSITAGKALVPLSQRLANAAVTVCTYIEKTFWPTRLAAFYPHPYLVGTGIPVWQIA